MANKPILTVIAGCNGSGKSTFSSAVTFDTPPSFDYDKEYLKFYLAEFDSDVRDVVAHNKTRFLLEEQIGRSIQNRKNFAYETNFNSTPLYWPEKFKAANYHLRLFYFCLNSIEEAKRRVRIRVENGGHFVSEREIELRYRLGFENLNNHWKYFDQIFLFETSVYKREPKHILSIFRNTVEHDEDIPPYLNMLIPDILN